MLDPRHQRHIRQFARSQRNARDEALLALYCGEAGQPLASDTAEGGVDAIALPLRQIVARALALDAQSILIAHTHPGGEARPSARDVRETLKLERALFPLAIGLADHLILAGQQRFSFREAGLI